MLSLAEIIAECQRGSSLAWEALVKRLSDRVYATAYAYLHDAEEARDATQEAFVRVFEQIGAFRGDDHRFIAWILTITRHRCIDRLRRRKTRQGSPPADETTDGPDSSLVEDEARRLVYRALDHLSSDTRDIIVLKDIAGLRLQDVAQILKVPIGAVKSRLSRAKVELAKAVVRLDPSFGDRNGL